MNNNQNLQTLLGKIDQLPTLPVIVTEINRLVSDPDSGAKEISNLIKNDIAITAKILKMVNSTNFGFSKRITGVKAAIVALGFKAVEEIAVTIAIFEGLGRDGSVGHFDRRKFWEHSLAVGIAAKIIAPRVGYQNAEHAFMAGLLHDLGRVIMDKYLPDHFTEAIDITSKENLLLYQAEKRVFKCTHAEFGSWLARKWKFSGSICDAIEFHHYALDITRRNVNLDLAGIVHISDILCRAASFGNGGDNRIPEIHPLVAERFKGFLNTDLTVIFHEIQLEMLKSSSFLKFIH